jgi:hypothetical protein
MQRKILLLAPLCFWPSAFAVELKPYPSAKITAEQWNQFYSAVKKELASGRGSFRYDAGELETYSDPKSYTMVAFTTPGHDAHPAWVTTRIVVEGKKIGVHVVGYHAGNEAAYEDFFQRMDAMAAQTLKSVEQK